MKNTILLIEDNEDMRNNTAEILELADYAVIKAKNGAEGIELVKKTRPDLILCDIMMPELDGYGVLSAIENIKELDTTPFIFLSALGEKKDVRSGMIKGADDYLTKPFSTEELLQILKIRLKKSGTIKDSIKRNKRVNQVFANVNHAKEVLNAFLMSEEEIKNHFQESFLIYKAKEVVSGDFYYLNKSHNKSVIALGDSTGHGVSASYISISVLNILNRIIGTQGFYNPSGMLNNIHEELLDCTKSDQNTSMLESADTAICVYDHKTRVLQYSSAQIQGAIIRNNEVIVLVMDDCSIGDHIGKSFDLTTRILQLQKGDCFYLFSDGLGDQFGGIEKRRFKNKRLIKLLVENHSLPMKNQKENIDNELNAWQGNLEQTDDITLLGMKID